VPLKLLFILLLFTQFTFQADPLERRIMRTHANGKEYVVLYFNKETGVLVKEEVFFSNGKPQWTGSYKDGKENGKWQYYYESGRLKTVENYLNGREHGISTEYGEDGAKKKDTYWKHGKLLKEVKY
jgi:antitoxin component YwqK of YwqJK toxin-antitoxin module